jgi:hypothetical protein
LFHLGDKSPLQIKKKINEILNNRTNRNINTELKIVETVLLKEDKSMKIEMFNKNMLNYSKLYRAIYCTLMSSEDFNNFSDYKVVISTAVNESKRFNLHNNIIFTKDITLKSFMDKCKLNLLYLSNIDYLGQGVKYVSVTIWDMRDHRNKNIKITPAPRKRVRMKHDPKYRSIHTSASCRNYASSFTPLK